MDLESCSPLYSRCLTFPQYDSHLLILILFYFLEVGAQQIAHGVTLPVEGNQDPSGYSTDERQSIVCNCELVDSIRPNPDCRCCTDQN